MANRLADSTSPYLLQHKDNPVDWYPWSDEAFTRAKLENKPVFLSIGYSSCHWCHVMAHECFEDQEVADALNASFINVKADREERPDVDEAYMIAVQMQTGRGGWPMSVFLTPDRKPFFGGTYFPKQDHPNSPGFLNLVRQIGGLWRTDQPKLLQAAAEFDTHLRQVIGAQPPATFDQFDAKLIEQTMTGLAQIFDADQGGFGAAPKFPPHTTIDFLLRAILQGVLTQEQIGDALQMAFGTLHAMIQGGLHDHVAGGFHRYSTDKEWLLPHFEKMLYDNALMLSNLAQATAIAQAAKDEIAEGLHRAMVGVINWVGAEMTDLHGLFCSALDADTAEGEGWFYTWTTDEVKSLLAAKADDFISAYNFDPEGNFADEGTGEASGRNILYLADEEDAQFEQELAILRDARAKRNRPMRDDKAIVGWNGLMIHGLAVAGSIDLAHRAAETILMAERSHGRLPRQITQGVPSGDAYLEDYAAFALALFELAEAEPTQSDRWRTEARRLTQKMIELFYDEPRGGFFETSAQHETLFGRSKTALDHPTPSGNALAVSCLVQAGDNERATKTLQSFVTIIQHAPHGTEAMLAAGVPLLAQAMRQGGAPNTAVIQQPQLHPYGNVISNLVADEIQKTDSNSDEANENTYAQAVIQSTPGVVQAVAATAAKAQEDVQVSLSARDIKADDDGIAQIVVLIDVPTGMHVNGPNPSEKSAIPTKIETEGVECQPYFPTQDDHLTGSVLVGVKLHMKPSERQAEFEMRVSFQACTQTECLPEKTVRFDCVLRS